jgi:hypothetical protein
MRAGYYRGEAERCHQRADDSHDPEAARRWRALARDYAARADLEEESSAASSAPMQPAAEATTDRSTKPVDDK